VYFVVAQYLKSMSLPAIHKILGEEYGVQISQSHVGNLLRLGLSLVHCRDLTCDLLRARLNAQGGIILSGDAVYFDEISPALYVLRDVLSGEFLAARRLELRGAEQLIPLFREVKDLGVPVLGIVSDKEAAIVQAAAEVFPESPHQFCQLHFLQNLAKPMEKKASNVGVGARQVIRDVRAVEKGLLKKQDSTKSEPGILSPADEEQSFVEDSEPVVMERGTSDQDTESGPEHKTAIKLCKIAASVGKCRGDSLLDPTFLKRFQRLDHVSKAAKKAAERPGGPWPLLTKLSAAFSELETYRQHADFLQRQVNVLRQIAHILKVEAPRAVVEAAFQKYLDDLRDRVTPEDKISEWSQFVDHVLGVSQRFWKGLFHCYDHPSLPSTNNAMEGLFGAIKKFSRRTTGRQSTSGGPMATCAEFFVDAFSLFRCSNNPELLSILAGIPEDDLDRARAEFKRLAEPARLNRSIARDHEQALEKVLEEWSPTEAKVESPVPQAPDFPSD
jgi:hypothetical protein